VLEYPESGPGKTCHSDGPGEKEYLGRISSASVRFGACALALAAVVGGCGSTQTVVKTVTASGTSATAAETTSASQAATEAQTSTSSASQARAGDTLELKGNGGEAMAVTVDVVMDPLQVGPDDQPDVGQRFVGVQITLRNVGTVAYSDSPSNGATLLSNIDEQAKGEIVSGGPCGNDFQSSANVAPGDTQEGCIPFELPSGQTPKTFQFTLNSGFADQTGQWSLRGAPTTGASATSTGINTDTGNTPVSPSTTPSANNSTTALPNQCSPGVAATQSVSCGLAGNVYYEYYQAEQNGGDTAALSAWSPSSKQYYTTSCSPGNGIISCSISGTTDPNAEVQITQASLDAYSPQQASSYASSHDAGPNG
jgi:hypothetical protein